MRGDFAQWHRRGDGICSRVTETRLGDVALEDLHDLFFGHGADDLVSHLAALENEERGDAADVELPCCVDVLINVELHHFQLAGVLARDFFDGRCKHMARAAPIGPEVHHHGLILARVHHFHLKIRVADCLKSTFRHVFFLIPRAGPWPGLLRYLLDDPAALGIRALLAASYSVT